MSRTLVKLLCEEGMCLSMGEARRACSMGAVRIDGVTMKDPNVIVTGEEKVVEMGRKQRKDLTEKK